MPISESTPLLWSDRYHQGRSRSPSAERLPYWRQDESLNPTKHKDLSGHNPHAQFCALVGCPPSNAPEDQNFDVPRKSLYGRTVAQLSSQRRAYNFSASLSNILLLSQVVLGAALTGLGASASSHILITIFGATNTIIAGIVAYLKSRGQPMRARMYRDDLERVVDEIENSEVMWRGISEGAHGYDEIDTDEVTVRSEVARLTRLYERAVMLNGMNNPDMYMAGAGGFDGNTSGGPRQSRGGPSPNAVLPAVSAQPAPQPSGENPGPAVPLVTAPEDTAPATMADVKDDKKQESKAEGKKPSTDGASGDKGKNAEASTSKIEGSSDAAPAPPPATASDPAPAPAQTPAQPSPQNPAVASALTPVEDPDASPATAAHLKPKRTKSDRKQVEGNNDAKKVSGDDES